MVQTHDGLEDLAIEYNMYFLKNEFCPIQKAYSTPHYLVLGVRFPGKTIYLYIGRGNAYTGFYLDHRAPPASLRIQDKLLDYVRKNLVGTMMGKISSLKNQFNICFSYKTDQRDNELLFGYLSRQLFFLNRKKNEIFSSLIGFISEGDKLEAHLPEHSVELKFQNNPKMIENYFLKEKEKLEGKKVQSKRLKFLEKKLLAITHDLEKVAVWKYIENELKDEILLEKFLEELRNENIFEICKYGQKIKFHSGQSSWSKRDSVYEKVKKLKKAEAILEQRSLQAQNELKQVKCGQFKYEHTKEKAISPLWKSKINKQVVGSNIISNLKIIKFQLGKLQGQIGLDAKSNDWLRQNSLKDSWWFHIENQTGAHCVLKTDDISQVDPENLALIGSMMSDYSKLTIKEIPLVFSQIKYVKGVKGAVGKVLIKKPRHLRVGYVLWKERITLIA